LLAFISKIPTSQKAHDCEEKRRGKERRGEERRDYFSLKGPTTII